MASDFSLNTDSGGKTQQVDGCCITCECFLSGDITSGKRQSYKLFMTRIRFCSHSTLDRHLLIENEHQNFLLYISALT